MPPHRKVLLAIDASDQSEQAFDWYLTSVHRPDNEVVLLYVPETLDSSDKNSSGDPVKEIEDKFNGKILENGISGRLRTESGSKPGEVICKIADEEEVAMIIVGTRGLGKVRRAIMGSVSDHVVHHAPCPVIVCRLKDA